VTYELDDGTLKRGRFAVLDRAPTTTPVIVDTKVMAQDFRLRYMDSANRWLEAWPSEQATDVAALPRAVQWRLRTREHGEIEGTVELVSAWPQRASGAQPGGDVTPPPAIRPVPGATR
jgi:general secretion pathway protein J